MYKVSLRYLAILICILALFCAHAEEAPGSDVIREAQQALYQLGYHDDNMTGEMDEATVSAIINYQTVNGLQPSGALDEDTLQLLLAGTGVPCYDYLSAIAQQYIDRGTYHPGDSGPEISHLQQTLLALHFYDGPNDGVFGSDLEGALRRFQLANGLSITGVADPSTLMRLYEGTPQDFDSFLESSTCVPGDVGSKVRLLQHCLFLMNYFSGDTTGVFGTVTRAAVTAFQSAHSLEVTGEADVETLRLLYNTCADIGYGPTELKAGASGDEVTDMQERLSSLGYYEPEITGFYGVTTETAVRLFQLANGLEHTGTADVQTLDRLYSDNAVDLAHAREHLSQLLVTPNAEKRALLLQSAEGLRGQSFSSGNEDIYSGYTFMQYVCVSAGIPLLAPDDLLSRASTNIGTVESLPAGTPVVLERAEGNGWLLCLYAGNGRIIYADMQSNWVLESSLSDIEHTSLKAWS